MLRLDLDHYRQVARYKVRHTHAVTVFKSSALTGGPGKQSGRADQMNVVYYVDTPPPNVVQSKFSSNSSFQDSAAVEAHQYAQLIRDSSVAYAPPAVPLPGSSRLVSGMTPVRSPALPVVQRTQWSPQLHATLCNATQINYLVRSLSIIYYYSITLVH